MKKTIVLLLLVVLTTSFSLRQEPLWTCYAAFHDSKGVVQIFNNIVSAVSQLEAMRKFERNVLANPNSKGIKFEHNNRYHYWVEEITDKIIIR